MVNLSLFCQFFIMIFKSCLHFFQNVNLLLVYQLSYWIKNLSHSFVGLFESFDKLCLALKILFGLFLNWSQVGFNFLCLQSETVWLKIECLWNWVHLMVFVTIFENALNANEGFLIWAKGCIKESIPSYFLECLRHCMKLLFLSLIRARFLGMLLTLSMKVSVLHWRH